MKRLFTLIELIIVIVVIGILVAIVIPNISNIKEESIAVSIKNNEKNLQTAVDMYALNNEGNYPTESKPTIGNPQYIDFERMHPDVLRSLPKDKDLKYQIDYLGIVYISHVFSPHEIEIDDSSGEVTWGEVPEANNYRVYEITDSNTIASSSGKKLKFIEEVNENYYKGKPDTMYAISAVDKFGYETAPASVDYEGDVFLYFDGGNSYFETDTSDIEDLSGELTIEALIKIDKLTKIHTIVGRTPLEAKETSFWMDVRVEKSETYMYFGGYDENSEIAYAYAPYPFKEGEWYYLVGVDDGSQYTLYVNGEKIHTESHIPRRTANNAKIRVGKRGIENSRHDFLFNGIISEVRIWNKAKTESEVIESETKEFTGEEENLVVYWKFNEGAGRKVIDYSRNGHHGSLHGHTWTWVNKENMFK